MPHATPTAGKGISEPPLRLTPLQNFRGQAADKMGAVIPYCFYVALKQPDLVQKLQMDNAICLNTGINKA